MRLSNAQVEELAALEREHGSVAIWPDGEGRDMMIRFAEVWDRTAVVTVPGGQVVLLTWYGGATPFGREMA